MKTSMTILMALAILATACEAGVVPGMESTTCCTAEDGVWVCGETGDVVLPVKAQGQAISFGGVLDTCGSLGCLRGQCNDRPQGDSTGPDDSTDVQPDTPTDESTTDDSVQDTTPDDSTGDDQSDVGDWGADESVTPDEGKDEGTNDSTGSDAETPCLTPLGTTMIYIGVVYDLFRDSRGFECAFWQAGGRCVPTFVGTVRDEGAVPVALVCGDVVSSYINGAAQSYWKLGIELEDCPETCHCFEAQEVQPDVFLALDAMC